MKLLGAVERRLVCTGEPASLRQVSDFSGAFILHDLIARSLYKQYATSASVLLNGYRRLDIDLRTAH